MSWVELLKQFGLPVAFLAVVLAFIWYIGRPFVNRLLDMIEGLLAESRAARIKDTEDFMRALDRRDAVAAKQTEVLEKLSEKIEGLPERLRDDNRRRR